MRIVMCQDPHWNLCRVTISVSLDIFLHSEQNRMQNEDIYDLILVMHYLKGIMTFYNEES
jgi:hypothetical protein